MENINNLLGSIQEKLEEVKEKVTQQQQSP